MVSNQIHTSCTCQVRCCDSPYNIYTAYSFAPESTLLIDPFMWWFHATTQGFAE